MKKVMAIGLCLFCMAVTGCGKEQLREGEIYDKAFTPAHSETTILPLTIYNGKTFTVTYIPCIYHYYDSYCIKIREYDPDKKNYKTAQYYTTKEVFDACEIGGIFIYDETRDFEEVQYEKKKENAEGG